MQFEELHQRQCQWTVPDQELRESLRLAVAEILLPAYRSFIKRFGYVSPPEKKRDKMLKHFLDFFFYFRVCTLANIHNSSKFLICIHFPFGVLKISRGLEC